MRLNHLKYLSCISIVWFNLQVIAPSQTPVLESESHLASISGRVTIGGKPVVGKKVLIARVSPIGESRGPYLNGDPSQGGDMFSAVTDAEGQYRVSRLPAGSYQVSVRLLGAYVALDQSGQRTRNLTLEGKDVTGIDFTLVRGGVITGRLTDADSRPLAASKIQVIAVQDKKKSRVFQIPEIKTDDRGIYRIYGLPAGRYLVSSDGAQAGMLRTAVKKYPLTYHPDADDEKKAKIIEVKEGSEINDVNIRLGPKRDLYDVTGHIVEAETGKPVSQVELKCWGVDAAGQELMNYASSASTDAQGNFRFVGLPSGRYDLDLQFPNGQGDYYYESSDFEVKHGNVTGIELKLKKGATISGTFVNDQGRPLGYPILPISITTQISNKERNSSISSDARSTRIGPDGSFSLTGVPPGIVTLGIGNSSHKERYHVLRLERDGVDISEGIEVRPGETIAGIRMVLAYGTGVIRGRINFAGGKPRENMRFIIFAHKEGTSTSRYIDGQADADDQGRFVIEGLVDGEYQVTASNILESPEQPSFHASQRVRVTGPTTPQLILTVDLSKPGRGK